MTGREDASGEAVSDAGIFSESEFVSGAGACIGITISEFDAPSQAMCPGNSWTFLTSITEFSATAVPQTPLPISISTQAGLPWNGPRTSWSFLLVRNP